MTEYPCEARNVNAFVSQVVNYVKSGHYYYVQCMIKERRNQTDPKEVDARVLQTYGIARKRWQRKRRHLKDNAGIHYLRYQNHYVFMLTKGKHKKFYGDHGHNVLDIRRKSLNVFSYAIKYRHSEELGRNKVFVRLGDEELRQLTAHMLGICTSVSYRDSKRMEREFTRLPYDAYELVFAQLLALARKVNRARRKSGFDPIDLDCLPKFVSVQSVYADSEPEGKAA